MKKSVIKSFAAATLASTLALTLGGCGTAKANDWNITAPDWTKLNPFHTDSNTSSGTENNAGGTTGNTNTTGGTNGGNAGENNTLATASVQTFQAAPEWVMFDTIPNFDHVSSVTLHCDFDVDSAGYIITSGFTDVRVLKNAATNKLQCFINSELVSQRNFAPIDITITPTTISFGSDDTYATAGYEWSLFGLDYELFDNVVQTLFPFSYTVTYEPNAVETALPPESVTYADILTASMYDVPGIWSGSVKSVTMHIDYEALAAYVAEQMPTYANPISVSINSYGGTYISAYYFEDTGSYAYSMFKTGTIEYCNGMGISQTSFYAQAPDYIKLTPTTLSIGCGNVEYCAIDIDDWFTFRFNTQVIVWGLTVPFTYTVEYDWGK